MYICTRPNWSWLTLWRSLESTPTKMVPNLKFWNWKSSEVLSLIKIEKLVCLIKFFSRSWTRPWYCWRYGCAKGDKLGKLQTHRKLLTCKSTEKHLTYKSTEKFSPANLQKYIWSTNPQKNLAKFKRGKHGSGLDDIDIEELDWVSKERNNQYLLSLFWPVVPIICQIASDRQAFCQVENNKKVKAVTILIYETAL